MTNLLSFVATFTKYVYSLPKSCQPKTGKIVNDNSEGATNYSRPDEAVAGKYSLISSTYSHMFTDYTEFLTYILYIVVEKETLYARARVEAKSLKTGGLSTFCAERWYHWAVDATVAKLACKHCCGTLISLTMMFTVFLNYEKAVNIC